MTDKEPIIIDGCNVSGCENYRPKDRFTCYPYICNCHQKPDCHYKQLARKTQECEELKERLVRTEEDLKYQCVDCMNVKSDRYRKALKEIKEIIATSLSDDHDPAEGLYGEMVQILDIIDRAKGE